MFDRTINVTLPNSLLQLEEGLRRSFPPVGIQKGILDSPCLLILLIYTKHKNNKIKSWTDTLSSFPWVKQTFSKMFEDISWNVWLNSLKCLATLPQNVWPHSLECLRTFRDFITQHSLLLMIENWKHAVNNSKVFTYRFIYSSWLPLPWSINCKTKCLWTFTFSFKASA